MLQLTTRRDPAVRPSCVIVRSITPWPLWLSIRISAVVTTFSKDFIVRQRVFMWILRTPSLTGQPRDGDVFKSNVLFAEFSYLTIQLTCKESNNNNKNKNKKGNFKTHFCQKFESIIKLLHTVGVADENRQENSKNPSQKRHGVYSELCATLNVVTLGRLYLYMCVEVK